jgi:gluconate 2-dehydrogenase gamma chain
MERMSRRAFLKAAGAAATAPAVPLAANAAPAASPGVQHAVAYTFLNPQESAFIEAAVARLIPADEVGPGALEANVAYFIDRQLGGAWGAGARLYRNGPFQEGTPSQGFQSAFAPAELFRRAIRAINGELSARGGTAFANLAPQEQDAYLTALQKERRDLGGVASTVFFESLLEMTIEGFFSDPAYGGNKDMVAWEMIGFPGAYADYYDVIDQYNVPYRRKPMSLAENARGQVDASAHAREHGTGDSPRKAR